MLRTGKIGQNTTFAVFTGNTQMQQDRPSTFINSDNSSLSEENACQARRIPTMRACTGTCASSTGGANAQIPVLTLGGEAVLLLPIVVGWSAEDQQS